MHANRCHALQCSCLFCVLLTSSPRPTQQQAGHAGALEAAAGQEDDRLMPVNICHALPCPILLTSPLLPSSKQDKPVHFKPQQAKVTLF
jgi:hypothetical protein